MRCALSAVKHDHGANRARRSYDPGYISQGARHVRTMCERDQPTPAGELSAEPAEVKAAFGGRLQETQYDASPLGKGTRLL